MSTQNRNTGGGGRTQKKSNSGSGGGGGTGGDTSAHAAVKKTDASKTEKEKLHAKPTAEQLRIAQITNSNTIEDPQMREKVATLTEMTQRSEEEVCCALYECDYNLERAVVFLLETLPVGAFETSSKKKKNKAAATGQPDGGAGDGEWADTNANPDKREKSRNRSSNRGGRGGTDSRGWRGRETRDNERNVREVRGDRDRDRGDRDREDRNDNYRGGPRGGGRREGGGRGGGFTGRGGRGGGRMSGGRGQSGRSGGYQSRQNANDDHQEVELWDNTIAQNAEKQLNQSQDDAWGDWDNEEYVGSLKDSKVFTTSNLPNQTVASVVSGGVGGATVGVSTPERSAPPGLEPHLGSAMLNNVSGGLPEDGTASVASVATPTTPMMQYSAAVTSSQIPPPSTVQPAVAQQQQQPAPQQSPVSAHTLSGGVQFNSSADAFTNAATAAANLVQQVQQQQPQIKSSATLSAEQSQYFNSLSSQNAAAAAAANAVAGNVPTYAQQTTGGSVQYANTYANVFGSGVTNSVTVPGGGGSANDAIQMPTGPPQRRARAKLPPPSKIPSSAVEMPGDSLNNIGYLDVQFGALDFGPDDSFDSIPEKFNSAPTVDTQAVQQQQQPAPQEIPNDFQNKNAVQQQALAATLQSTQIGDSLATAYTQRGAGVGPQQQVVVGGGASAGNTALEQLAKADPYNQAGATNSSSFQSAYQATGGNKTSNAYQQTPPGQTYNSSSYGNVQSSVANAYQGQSYGSYQQNSVNSYQQQQPSAVVGGGSGQSGGVVNSASNSSVPNSGTGNSAQNIPGASNSSTASNQSSAYLSSGYTSQPSAYQSTQSVYGSSGLSNSAGGFSGTNTSSSQYSNFSTSAKLKDTSSSNPPFESVTSNTSVASNSGPSASSVTSSAVNSSSTNTNNSASVNNSNSTVNNGSSNGSTSSNAVSSNNNSNAASVVSGVTSASSAGNVVSAAAAATASSSTSANKNSAGGMVPNIQMVSQYIQTGLPYYQQQVYSYEDIQMMQQRVPHVQGYYDLNYTPTSLGAGRDNLGSVAYSAMTDGRFTRTDNNSSPVGNVSSTMSQQAGSGGPMLNVPYYFYSGNMMPGGFQYGTPAIYPPQIPAANTAAGGQFPKPSYNTGYGSTSYDALSQASQEYSKGAYPSSVTQQTKSQNATNPPQTGTGTDITSSMYGKGHVALNKVNSYEKQNFHSGTPPPFNMPNTQTAGGTSAQPYGMYLPMPATAGHHNMIHQPIHQMDGRIHSSSRRDSNSTGQRQQTSSQSKSGTKQGYSPSYWTGQN